MKLSSKKGETMPRDPRTYSETGFYHVIVKGDGGMTLFDSDADRLTFLSILDVALGTFNVSLIAWCLMSNHVHILIEDPKRQMSAFMQQVETSYARYFNISKGRKGSVFQGRFLSIPIMSEGQLLSCVFYIHDNPLKGMGIDPATYYWSSRREYVGVAERTSTALILEMLGGVKGFLEASEHRRFNTYFVKNGSRIPDDDVANAIRSAIGGIEPSTIRGLSKQDRADAIKKMRGIGLSVKQISRATGLGIRTIVRDARS